MTATITEIIERLPDDKTQIIGVTGQAGAGKTSISSRLQETAGNLGRPTRILSLDSFFILSSTKRKEWLEEGRQDSETEFTSRSDQMCWWDFRAVKTALETLKSGLELNLTGIYNRDDGGELTGRIKIRADKGRIILFEGVATAHLKNYLNLLFFLYVPWDVRFRRIESRDTYRSGAEARGRFEVTQQFEEAYFRAHWGNIDYFIDNSNTSPEISNHNLQPDIVLTWNGWNS